MWVRQESPFGNTKRLAVGSAMIFAHTLALGCIGAELARTVMIWMEDGEFRKLVELDRLIELEVLPAGLRLRMIVEFLKSNFMALEGRKGFLDGGLKMISIIVKANHELGKLRILESESDDRPGCELSVQLNRCAGR